MSSARIPLLSGDLPFFEFVDCGSQLSCRDLRYSRHPTGVIAMHIDSLRFLVQTLLVNPFWRRDDFSFVILYLGVIPGMYSLDVLLSFHCFLSLIHFFAFTHFFQALFFFFGRASSLLDESSDFNVFL